MIRVRPLRALGLAVLALTASSGCAVGPNYHRPKMQLPPDFRFAKNPTNVASVADLPWWEVFRDDALQALLREALENNFDLRIAVARVEQSRALARAAGAQLLPGIGVMGAAAYADSTASPFGGATVYAGSILASWEPDVFGGLRRSAEQARASYFASEEARRNVWLTVQADVAQSYFRLLALDLEHEIALRTIRAREETLDLYRTQLSGGVATALQVARAEADVHGAQATCTSIELQIATTEDAISLLLGVAPRPVSRSPSSGRLAPPPDVPAGLPSTLLERRPDVRYAEQQLVAANAQVGVETAKFFPTFPLTAAPALSSLSVGSGPLLLMQGFAYVLLASAQWTAPVLKGGALVAQLDAAKATKSAATIAYERTMYTALQEVADALVSLDRMHEQRGQEEGQVAELSRAVDIAESQFRGGTASYLDVVSAQEVEFAAELALAQLEGEQLVEFVQLYRALGGGWWLAKPRP